MKTVSYRPKHFNLTGLEGISDKTIDMHLGLYEGYVHQTNQLLDQIAKTAEEKGALASNPPLLKLRRRLAFEYGGMTLHENYFNGLIPGGSGKPSKEFLQGIQKSFGGFKIWQSEFIAIGNSREVGWVVLFQDHGTGIFSNHWITLHHQEFPSSLNPVLVMDMWEHAYLLDYNPSEKRIYMDAFFSNINWDAINDGAVIKKRNPLRDFGKAVVE